MNTKLKVLLLCTVAIAVVILVAQLYFTDTFKSPHHKETNSSSTTRQRISTFWKKIYNNFLPGPSNTNATEPLLQNPFKEIPTNSTLTKTSQQNITNVQPEHSTQRSSSEAPQKKTEKVKVVLYYTTWFGDHIFPYEGINQKTSMFEYPNGQPCEYKCRITYNKNELHTSDAVMFHGRDMPGNIHEISKSRRNYKQKWVYQIRESPINSGRDPATMNGIFNWTFTYQTDSDVIHSGSEYRQLRQDEVSKLPKNVNYAKLKTNLVTWSVGHCNSEGLRDQIVQKLTQFLPISINGKCASLFPKRKKVPSCGNGGSPACNRWYKSTKFYLSFENSVCKDYITEKYWSAPLDNGMVPIVYGPQTYYRKLAIPVSYINLYDFPSIEALANYIKYLDKNDTAYNEYFTWRTKYKVIHEPHFACRFCKKLHNETLPPKTYNDLGSFFSKTLCNKFKEGVKKYI